MYSRDVYHGMANIMAMTWLKSTSLKEIQSGRKPLYNNKMGSDQQTDRH